MSAVFSEQTINNILNDIERGIPRPVAVAYHTARQTAPPPTMVKPVQQTIIPSVQARPKQPTPTVQPAVEAVPVARNGRDATLETMTVPQMMRVLRRLWPLYSAESIAANMRDSNGLCYSAQAIRFWMFGTNIPLSEGIDAIRRFLIAYRDRRSTMTLKPAGPRSRTI